MHPTWINQRLLKYLMESSAEKFSGSVLRPAESWSTSTVADLCSHMERPGAKKLFGILKALKIPSLKSVENNLCSLHGRNGQQILPGFGTSNQGKFR